MYISQPSKTSSAGDWTLRFRQHKTTILLLTPPTQPFTTIKKDLLAAIRATGISAIDGNSLPSDSEAIVFGVPHDKNDISKGWLPLKIPEVEDGDTKGKGIKKGTVLNESPLGAGLQNGALLAFKFQDEDAEENDVWDVIMPSYEDEPVSQGR